MKSNAALTMSKRLGLKPLEIAERLSASIRTAAATQTYPVISDVTISGPGFLNLQLSLPFLQTKLQGKIQDAGRVGVPQVRTAQRVVVDYSSPNIAKEMHVVTQSNSILNIMEFTLPTYLPTYLSVYTRINLRNYMPIYLLMRLFIHFLLIPTNQ